MPAKVIRKANAGLDERLGTQKWMKSALDHIFPDNWSFMLGELAMYCFLILVVTGIWLAMFYDPSDSTVVYHGSYQRLYGESMSAAYQSVVHISLGVHAGLLIRQVHHWAADLFVAAIVAHMLRLFFSGAFRKPRELNWMIGVTLLITTIMEGFAGYSLPEDLMSGLGLRIGYTIAVSVPVVGNWIAFLFFGGKFPSYDLAHRLYVFHVFVLPLVIFALIGVHLAFIWRQKHTQFPGAGRSEKRVVGAQVYPAYTFRSAALLCVTAGALFILGGLVQINPIWQYGFYEPYMSSSFAQPDFYTGWMEGSLRIFPAFQLPFFGYRVADPFWPSAFFMTATFVGLYAYPWLERWWTGDHLMHNLLDRPRDRPGRTAFGVAICTFYVVCFVAGSQDFMAFELRMPQVVVTEAFRGMALGLPFLTGFVAWRVCLGVRGIPEEPPELPVADHDSARPPSTPYLPERAKWQRPETGEPVTRPARR